MSHLNKSLLTRTRVCIRAKMHDNEMYDKLKKKNKNKNKKKNAFVCE